MLKHRPPPPALTSAREPHRRTALGAPAGPLGRISRWAQHLTALATKPGENCGLFQLAALFFLLTVSSVSEAAPGRAAVLTDLEVNESIEGDVVVFGADLVLGTQARITGDAVAVGGNVRIVPGAEVGRHVVSVFGAVEMNGDAVIGGRVLALSSLASFANGAGVTARPPRVSFAMRLLASGGWLLVTTGIAFLFPIRMRFAAWSVPMSGMRIPALGLMIVLTAVVSLLAALGLGPAFGVPLVAALMVLFFIGKSLGLTVLGCVVGAWVLRRWIRHPLPISLEVFIGVLVLLALRFAPIIGDTLWTLTSLIALGASITVLSVTGDPARAEV